jgi:hypothetical protein
MQLVYFSMQRDSDLCEVLMLYLSCRNVVLGNVLFNLASNGVTSCGADLLGWRRPHLR